MTLAVHLPDALANLPWLVQIPVALALVAGLVLWLAGRRLIRPVTIMVGLGVGGLIGFLVLPVLMPGFALSPYLGMLAGAASGLTTALLLYQVATAITFGSAIGAGCGVAAAAILGSALTLPAASQLTAFEPDPDNPGTLGGGEQPVYVPPPPVWNPRVEPLPEPEAGPEGADVENPGVIRAKPVDKQRPKANVPTVKPAATSKGNTAAAGTKPKPAAVKKPAAPGNTDSAGNQAGTKSNTPVNRANEFLPPAARDAAEGASGQVREFWDAARSAWSAWWDSVPVKNRPWIMGATVGGIAIGTLLGLLLPAWSAGGVTALAGSAIWLPAAVWLGTAWNTPGVAAARGLSTGSWIAIWLTVAVIGVACQWYGLLPGKPAKGKGKKKKTKPKAGDEE